MDSYIDYNDGIKMQNEIQALLDKVDDLEKVIEKKDYEIRDLEQDNYAYKTALEEIQYTIKRVI